MSVFSFEQGDYEGERVEFNDRKVSGRERKARAGSGPGARGRRGGRGPRRAAWGHLPHASEAGRWPAHFGPFCSF